MGQADRNTGWQRGWLLLPLLLISLIWSSTADASWEQSLYSQLGLAGKLDKQTFRQALNSYQTVRHKLLYHTWVSHGRNSGELAAERFSNQLNSRQSSLGVYRTAETYLGKHGYSLRLDGLSPGKNSNARKRAIVVHGATYASPTHLRKYDKLGRSWGCPALPKEQARAIIDTIKGGSVIYAHG
ncbi:murein L,D-transpeptidase catalytic domain family protein [Aeromonas allosaccharophila]|uniref:murein L,D-transpeptidase catalytic domain family protein n=1 Tax=Aeromonas allosaccharophila TaxID=656 RepID=UPI002B45953D|nr:murein L,D-transpeptidase catalytic domain family protein [Aeromonas allosaccharophila]